jgi:hypothetical protein
MNNNNERRVALMNVGFHLENPQAPSLQDTP